MDFSEQAPSTEWAPLKYRGEALAEVWFKPEDEPWGLTFRVPLKAFHFIGQRLTPEILLRSVGVKADEVETWSYGDTSHEAEDGANPALRRPLAPPDEGEHLEVWVRLKAPPALAPAADEPELDSAQLAAVPAASPEQPPAAQAPEIAATEKRVGDVEKSPATSESPRAVSEPDAASARWDQWKARWDTILGLEAAIDTQRLRLEGLRSQMEAAWSQTLNTEEKVNALNADMTRWNKAKSRIHYALPKIREFVHRAMWVVGAPERKAVEVLFQEDAPTPDVFSPEMARVPDELESLLKGRQVLQSQGENVYQECHTILGEVQSALRTLQSNAAANERKKKHAGRGGKFFKDVRRLSGADG